MGVKVKGGMWCDTCQKAVAGQKSTAKVAKVGATVLSGGLYPALPGGYHCPTCGSPVRRLSSARASTSDRVLGWTIVGAVAVGVVIIAGIVGIVHALQGPHTVPNVQNMSLTEAKSQLKSAGLGYRYNSNQGAFGILDESNWLVCGEDPPPGTKTKNKVFLDVRHYNC